MARVYTKWDRFELPPLTESYHYDIPWPRGTSQLTKELICFKKCRMGERLPGMRPALIHFLNIQRLLFPHMIDIYKDVPKGRVWNNYYLDAAEELCDFTGTGQERNVFTGPASASKTYCVANYAFTSFIMAPMETMAMVSTTSGAASERRIWADIKDFHREGRYEQCGIQPVGAIIEYLKAIVFDPGKELEGKKETNRDFRNGIQVIPIAVDSKGEAALTTIQGTKNVFVIWALDEMAQMTDGVTRPNGNLGQNPHYHFIGIGNANRPDDPHGKACAPVGGLDGLSPETRRWTAATGHRVLLLHGDETPNNHPYIDQTVIKKVTDFPFPYISNRISADIAALEYGNGSITDGRETADYWKFCKGVWPPVGASNNLYTKQLFKNYDADQPHDIIIYGIRPFGSGDFAFSAGGDANVFYTATFGFNKDGLKRINFAKETTAIRSKAVDKKEFIRQIASLYFDQIKRHNIDYKDFGADTGNDASLTFNELSKLASTYDFKGISSIDAAFDSRYANRVTELWFRARDLIKTGICRGIDLTGKHVSQLTERKYNQVGKNKYQIEEKKKMKIRMGRSPDDADAFVYLCNMIIESGIVDEEIAEVKRIKSTEEEARSVTPRTPEEYHRAVSGDDTEEDMEHAFHTGNDLADYNEGW